MFGRKKKVQFASQTIVDKYALVAAVRDEADSGVWFEEGEHPAAKAAVTAYLQHIESTEDIVYLTVNSLAPDLRARAEMVAPSLIETLAYPHSALGLGGSPAYYAHNAMLRDLFGVDFMDSVESDQRAADETITMGLMRYAQQQVDRGLDERTAQSVVVAVTLGAGWLQSPERSRLHAG